MKDKLKMGYVMDKEYKNGQMEVNMKVLGFRIRYRVWESSLILMEIFMKGSGRMIGLVAMEYILILRQRLNIKATGKMI